MLNEPAGIARLRLEVEALERLERDDSPDRRRALLLQAKRNTLRLLERTHAELSKRGGHVG